MSIKNFIKQKIFFVKNEEEENKEVFIQKVYDNNAGLCKKCIHYQDPLICSMKYDCGRAIISNKCKKFKNN